MKLQKLAAILLAMSSLLAVQMAQAQDNAQKQVELAELAKLPVKTIVPITAKTREQALEQAKVIAANPDADLAEFRIDLLDFANDTKQVIALGQELRQILATKPIIATIRTHNEGGKLTISDADYGKTYQAYLSQPQPFMDMLDVEMFRDQQVVKNTVKLAHDKKVLIVMSNHDFQKTPSEDEIVKRLLKQDELGADILKIAVMPQSKQDVFTLMNATLKVSQQSKKPLLTMSMGKLGTISRIATANMGGSFSFGMIGEASAPGQIDVTQLKQFLKMVQPTQ
ncbi:type I 3-dehydroquinate dehydratase [Acinetobacter corruptisaponis]|uniref:3-dehydroquinate dehydratase n=1 Tax=Acinetobacter corruptisaponis TaxID=3045147 RepID=A0ABY8S6A8_9GAMM|nr:type I 3-dehydroquinate dehydratase [Acinetobacter sp. KCTC 92772]WHP06037.1 type I 3-dehydroquinate dehydratase [Acinetobacter sp. KCTC 92772]